MLRIFLCADFLPIREYETFLVLRPMTEIDVAVFFVVGALELLSLVNESLVKICEVIKVSGMYVFHTILDAVKAYFYTIFKEESAVYPMRYVGRVENEPHLTSGVRISD